MAESSRSSSRDAELVARFLGGDPAGFEGILDAHGKAVFNFIKRFIGDPEASRDVFQETLLAALKSLSGFDRTRPLLPWLLGIAVHRCREERRRRRTVSLEDALPDGSASGGDTPEELAARREAAAKVANAVASLDDAHRAVFLFRIYQAFTYGQIGEILNISEGTAKSRMHYAMYNVRKLLKASPGGGDIIG
ncbi:MAG: RNA polymerase sigma factor [Planctomycetota bacterium]|jgi:RNA polymerase sigma-70 factor (ECF subfamily)